MEASALRQTPALPHLAGHSPLLRLQSDEKLVALVRKGHSGAFDALVQRYQPRLLAFCRHMLNSQEDAEDVLQEVFAASYNALLADERPINARPWLYRIARNRCLNHLRKPRPSGQDSMDIFENDHGVTTAEKVHRREEFREIVADVQELPETQRTALLLREIDALSYDQIAEAMDTTIPSVKSLLVRARVGLAEASEARMLTCEEVRLQLGEVQEGLAKTTAPMRRHLKTCERCRTFRTELRSTSKALAAVLPVGSFVFLKKIGIAKLGLGGGAAAGSAAASGSMAAGTAGIAAGGAGMAATTAASSAISAGVGTLASKAAAGMAAAAIVTAGAVEVNHAATRGGAQPQTQVAIAPRAAQAPAVTSSGAEARAEAAAAARKAAAAARKKAEGKGATASAAAAKPKAPVATTPAPTPAPVPTTPAPAPTPTPAPTQNDGSTTTLPPKSDPAPSPVQVPVPGLGSDTPSATRPPQTQPPAQTTPTQPPAQTTPTQPPAQTTPQQQPAQQPQPQQPVIQLPLPR